MSYEIESRILAYITAIILFIFWGIILYLSIISIPKVNPGNGGVISNCPPGQCATNIYNGEKRCPPPNTIIASDLGLEVCNPPGSCIDSITPYAIQSDGSTDLQGTCQVGVNCRCTNIPSCPIYITSVFETISGNPYVSTNGQRTTFKQRTESIDPNTGLVSSNPPLIYKNPAVTFCAIPAEWLPRSSPGCTFTDTVDAQSITQCMGLQRGCDGQPVTNPCLRGTLAFITTDPDNFNSSQIDRIPIGCVEATPCPCGNVAIWDTNLGAVICKVIT